MEKNSDYCRTWQISMKMKNNNKKARTKTVMDNQATFIKTMVMKMVMKMKTGMFPKLINRLKATTTDNNQQDIMIIRIINEQPTEKMTTTRDQPVKDGNEQPTEKANKTNLEQTCSIKIMLMANQSANRKMLLGFMMKMMKRTSLISSYRSTDKGN
jgi:hypothetical protein